MNNSELLNSVKKALFYEVLNQSKRCQHARRIVECFQNTPDSKDIFEVGFEYAECDLQGHDLFALDSLDTYVDILLGEINRTSPIVKFRRTDKGSTDSVRALIPIKWEVV